MPELTAPQRTILYTMTQLEKRFEWVTSSMADEAIHDADSTPVMGPLADAGLVRRIHYGRRYAYRLTGAGRAAITGGGSG